MTRDGVILGTAAYMSPEQARGKAVDKRTDIWAFGCVLYEMLTGKVVFPGETVSDTIAAVLDREPNWAALPATTPTNIRRLLERCLEKDQSVVCGTSATQGSRVSDAVTSPAKVTEPRTQGHAGSGEWRPLCWWSDSHSAGPLPISGSRSWLRTAR